MTKVESNHWVKIINSRTLIPEEKKFAEKLKNEILAEEQTKKIQESTKKKLQQNK
jgi:hypothetical protein